MSSILLICTANQCRSVIAEHLLQRRLNAAGLDWQVSSAGTHARPGTSAQPSAVAVLAERGITVDPQWRSRPVTPELVEDADLVLTATHQHLTDVLLRNPRASKRTFALVQFARLLDAGRDGANGADGAGHPSELVVLAARGRLGVQPRARELDDIADPIGGPVAEYRRCSEVIDTALESITRRVSAVDRTRSSTAR